ncbi:hypothetical protein AAVH_40835 [Aphelenchoides avenae]|nr:hypothetical protein AAVH_40835 [Aphelenchus avenae]
MRATNATELLLLMEGHRRMDSGVYWLGIVALTMWTLVVVCMTKQFWTGDCNLSDEENSSLRTN